MAEWPGTHSSNEIPLTMLCSTRLRGMSNVIPTRPTRGPVHGWSISNLVRQADIDVSERETGAMRKVSISSLSASTLPSRDSNQNGKPVDDAKQEKRIAKSTWHKASERMCPGPVFHNVTSPYDISRLLYQPSKHFPLLKHRPTRSHITQKLQAAQLRDIESFAPAVLAWTPKLPHQKEAKKFTHITQSTNNNTNLRLDEIGPGLAHEVVQIKHFMPVTDIHKIFESPLTSASWIANDVLLLCATSGQALQGALLSVIEVQVDAPNPHSACPLFAAWLLFAAYSEYYLH